MIADSASSSGDEAKTAGAATCSTDGFESTASGLEERALEIASASWDSWALFA